VSLHILTTMRLERRCELDGFHPVSIHPIGQLVPHHLLVRRTPLALRVFLLGVFVLAILSLAFGLHFLLLDRNVSIALGIHLLGFALGAEDGLGELMVSGGVDVSFSFTVGAGSGLVIGGEIAFVSSFVGFWLRRVGTQELGFGGAGLLGSRSFGGLAVAFGGLAVAFGGLAVAFGGLAVAFGGLATDFGSRDIGGFSRLTIYQ